MAYRPHLIRIVLVAHALTFTIPHFGYRQANADEIINTGAQTHEIPDAGTVEIPALLSLNESLKLASKKNIDLKRAAESVTKQKARVVEARGALFPEVSINSNASRLDEGRRISFQNGQQPNAQTWNGNVQLDQPIYRGGKGYAGKEIENCLLDAIEWQHHSVKNDVALQVYQNYFKVLLDRELLKVREEAVTLLQDELVRAQKKLSVGTVSNFDVIRAEVAFANAKTPLIQAQNSLSLSLEDLKRVLNTNIDRELLAPRISDTLIKSWDSYTLDQALELTAQQNPELKRLSFVVIASEHGIDFQRADFLPALTLSVNYGIERTAFFNKNLEGWQAGLNLKWKIFDSLQTVGRVEQAQSEFKDAKLALEKAKLDADLETRRTIASVQEARALVNVSSKVIDQAKESFRLAKNRFDVGAATQLDVLSERLALTEARSNQAQSLFSQNIAEAKLRGIMGVLADEFK